MNIDTFAINVIMLMEIPVRAIIFCQPLHFLNERETKNKTTRGIKVMAKKPITNSNKSVICGIEYKSNKHHKIRIITIIFLIKFLFMLYILFFNFF